MSYASSLRPQIRAILEGSDLSTISAKGVRKQIVSNGADEEQVKEHRKAIDAIISEIYDELTAAAPSPTPSSEDVPLTSRPAAGGSHVPIPQSSQPEPLRKVKREVKEEKPHSNGSAAETDEEMARRLQLEFDALTGNRASRSAGTSARTKKPKKKTPKRKSAEGVDSDGEPVKKKRAGGGGGAFNKELILSDSLAAFTGETKLSRPQTVKRIWDYVKGNGLQDSSDKRFILCDDKLKSVFHVDKLHMFTMNKLLVPHFRDPDEIVETKGEVKAEYKPAAPPAGVSVPEVISDSDEDDEDF